MKRAYTNGILLDGTEQMQPVAHKILLTEDDKITAIVDDQPACASGRQRQAQRKAAG